MFVDGHGYANLNNTIANRSGDEKLYGDWIRAIDNITKIVKACEESKRRSAGIQRDESTR